MSIKATICILTFNGEKYLNDIFRAIINQKVDFSFEVLVIDSGSTDKTLDIIKKYFNKINLRLHQIPNSEFGHGKTRNLAAELAYGEYLVYLTHDAIPASNTWLYEILKPFDINPRILGVMGKQTPRPKCFPLLKYEISNVFKNLGPDLGTTLFYKDSFLKNKNSFDAVCFYSDVNSATLRRVILEQIPYREVNYAEDQLFGKDIIEQGFTKAYAARANVWHSNDLSLSEYKKRIFDETLALINIGIYDKSHTRNTFKSFLKGVFVDMIRIAIDGDYSIKRKVYWAFINPLFHFQKRRGVNLAVLAVSEKSFLIKKYSLEEKIRNSK